MARKKDDPNWIPGTDHLDWFVAKVDPDYVQKHGRMRRDYEANLAIDRCKNWSSTQPRQFRIWALEQIQQHLSFYLPKAYNRLLEIASGERKGSRAGEEVAACKLFMERFDPEFKRDKTQVNVDIRSIHEIVATCDAEPYDPPSYDTEALSAPSEEAEEFDELRDPAIQELVGEDAL